MPPYNLNHLVAAMKADPRDPRSLTRPKGDSRKPVDPARPRRLEALADPQGVDSADLRPGVEDGTYNLAVAKRLQRRYITGSRNFEIDNIGSRKMRVHFFQRRQAKLFVLFVADRVTRMVIWHVLWQVDKMIAA